MAVKGLPGRHAVEDLDTADFDQPVAAQRIKAGGFGIENDFAHELKTAKNANQVRRRGILAASTRMSRIRARTGSSPCEVSTTKSARLRFSASGSLPRQDGIELLAGHVVARQNSLALNFRRGRDHHHRIDALLAAGLKQQRHIDHRDGRAGSLGVVEEFLPGGAQHRMHDLPPAASSRPDHAPLAPTAARDRPCRPRSCPETPLRWQAPPRLHIACERWRRHRRRERRLPRTALRWSISPSRSSRSTQELSFRTRHWPPCQNSISHAEQPLAAQKRKQLQQRQAEDGEMIAFDALEQMHPQPFELVGADA